MRRVLPLCAAISLLISSGQGSAQTIGSGANPPNEVLDEAWLARIVRPQGTRSVAQARLPNWSDHRAALTRMYPGPGEGCRTSVLTTYDIRGFWLPATVRVCGDSIADVSTGAYAPAPGQRLFFVNGRGHRGSMYSLTRAVPNTAYEFTRMDNDENGYFTYGAAQPTLWSQVASALPFVPFAVATYSQNGHTRYAYTDLRIPAGLERYAYPLNSNSIILSVDGFIFSSANALAAMLTHGGGDTPYVEIFYAQRGEIPQRMRRAFIPRLSLAEAGADWQRLAAASNVGRRDRNGDIMAFIGVMGAFAALWHLDQALGISESMRRQRAECLARADPIIVC